MVHGTSTDRSQGRFARPSSRRGTTTTGTSRPFRYVDRLWRAPPARLIAISDAVGRFSSAPVPARELTTIHYGLDDLPRHRRCRACRSHITADRTLAVAIGRLIAQKDHATLLRGFALVRRAASGHAARDPRLGTARGADAGAAKELGIEAAVILPGRAEPRDWLARADVFVHLGLGGIRDRPARGDARRAARVATRVSAVPRSSSPVDGISSRERRRRRRALGRLLADAALRTRLGAAGRERAQTSSRSGG